MASQATPNWRSLALKKHHEILSAIPEDWRLPSPILTNPPKNLLTPSFLHPHLTPLELEITTTPLRTLLSHLATGHWTSLAVTTAFAHRAALAHQLTSCLSEFPLAQALTTARALDAHLAQHKQPIGALHGLPVSLKDSIDVRGVGTTLGFVAWTARPPRTRDAALAAILREQGAVLFAKTAVPQASFATETFGSVIAPPTEGAGLLLSLLCGDVPSPLNTALSAGGSSGGEAALVGFRASPLGFGTDIGGSIRWPAASVGAYGIRPSRGRLPYAGIASVVGGLEAVTDVAFAVGPMSAGEVGDLGVAVRAVLAGRPWERDALAVEMAWREEVYRSVKEREKLVLGVMAEDGLVDLHPNVRRAVAVVRELVTKAGHEVRVSLSLSSNVELCLCPFSYPHRHISTRPAAYSPTHPGHPLPATRRLRHRRPAMVPERLRRSFVRTRPVRRLGRARRLAHAGCVRCVKEKRGALHRRGPGAQRAREEVSRRLPRVLDEHGEACGEQHREAGRCGD